MGKFNIETCLKCLRKQRSFLHNFVQVFLSFRNLIKNIIGSCERFEWVWTLKRKVCQLVMRLGLGTHESRVTTKSYPSTAQPLKVSMRNDQKLQSDSTIILSMLLPFFNALCSEAELISIMFLKRRARIMIFVRMERKNLIKNERKVFSASWNEQKNIFTVNLWFERESTKNAELIKFQNSSATISICFEWEKGKYF